MTTVVDPLGTPAPVYNRSGTAIVSVTANDTTPPSIPRVSGWTVALVATGQDDRAVKLPSGADIGDVVEVYVATGTAFQASVHPPSSETIHGSSTPADVSSGRLFRKTGSSDWQVGAL